MKLKPLDDSGDWRIIIVFILFGIIIIGMYTIPSLFSKTEPAIFVYLSGDKINILGFTHTTDFSIPPMCIACDSFSAQGEVKYGNQILCKGVNNVVGLGEAHISIICPKIEEYENKSITVTVVGYINEKKVDEVTETLVLKFKDKDELRS